MCVCEGEGIVEGKSGKSKKTIVIIDYFYYYIIYLFPSMSKVCAHRAVHPPPFSSTVASRKRKQGRPRQKGTQDGEGYKEGNGRRKGPPCQHPLTKRHQAQTPFPSHLCHRAVHQPGSLHQA